MIERYSRGAMAAIWSEQSRYETWLEVELAACAAMEQEGQVPAGSAERVRDAVCIDASRIHAIEERVRHDVIAFLSHVEEQAGEDARWLHLGMTSSDVLDTALALQLRRAGDLIMAGVDRLREVLGGRARELKDLPMVGRTHGIHAEPTTVGLVFLGFRAELNRQRRRLDDALSSVRFGKLSGAVGVYGNLSPVTEARALRSLGLEPEPCATQVVPRDRHAELFCALAQLAASLERIAVQVRHWQRTEVGEAREPFGGGQKGSSAMPHKRNPILSENLCGLSRLVRSHAAAALENVPLWHERDISHSSVERVIAPDATTLVDFMLHRLAGMMEGLVIDRGRVGHNLDRLGELLFSEAVMLALVNRGLRRQQAYELVQRQALAAADHRGRFRALLAADPDIGRHLDTTELDACFDLDRHLRHVDHIFERVLGKGELER
jgi:adenylosuccinate lyase